MSDRTIRQALADAASNRYQQLLAGESGPPFVRVGVVTVELTAHLEDGRCTVVAREWCGRQMAVISG